MNNLVGEVRYSSLVILELASQSVAGKVQVVGPERVSHNQAWQDRPAGGWAGQPALRFGCPC
ncbi:hypothetical protein Maes01_02781 [Microbulbifer aestuariivivens]|uniref:Uncharacterized protein n=1 Tax=Microbulbifer aestuariivivens TaxID=1908308 RepID=A0ABP9WSJ6_9GAMM